MSAPKARHNGEGSIFPYRNGFAAYVWITTPAGRRVRKYVYGQSREVVHERWVKLSSEARRRPIPSTVPTVDQYLQRWLSEEVAPNLAPLTYATYESHVRHYIVPGVGARKIDRLSVADVQRWLNRLPTICQCCAQGKDERRKARGTAKCCAVGKCCHSIASPRTVNDVRGVLRSALTSAMREELIARNVACLVKVPRKGRRKVVPWSSEEARLFLESARHDQDRLYAAFVLVLVLGMRKGEVLGLTWESVGFEDGELQVERQLQRVRRELVLRERTKTESSDSSLPMPAIVVQALKDRRIRQDQEQAEAGEAWMVEPRGPFLVFSGRYGTPIDPRTLNRAFARRCAIAGVRACTVHDARRTCATLLVDLGVHPRVIMRVLRHADQAVTMEVYAKASSEATAEALRKLGEALQ